MEAVKLDNFLKVDKGIPVPLYYQIKQGILQAIQEGALKVEDMIPIPVHPTLDESSVC